MRQVVLSLFFMAAFVPAAFADQEAGKFSQWHFNLNGEERLRYEYRDDFDFNESRKDSGSQLYHRLRLGGLMSLTDEYLRPKADFFIEGLDAQAGGYRIKAARNQVDDFDLHQAYIYWHNIAGSDFNFKVGRQQLHYGRGRLLTAPAWANRMRTFMLVSFIITRQVCTEILFTRKT